MPRPSLYRVLAPVGVALFTATLLLATPRATFASDSQDHTEARIASGLQNLRTYETSHSLETLKAAVVGVGTSITLVSISPTDYVARRRSLVGAFAQLFGSIDASYDPTYDASKMYGCPQPPSGENALPRCAPPSMVKDATARVTYAAQLAAFNHSLAQATYFRNLSNIDNEAMSLMTLDLKLFLSAPDDSAALLAIVKGSDMNPVRAKILDAMLLCKTYACLLQTSARGGRPDLRPTR